MEETKGIALSTREQQTLSDIRQIIEDGRKSAYGAINSAMVRTYWNVGRRIVEEEQNGTNRAEYGKHLLEVLSLELSKIYGKGFTARNLRNFRQFYTMFPDYEEIWHARVPNLTWTHFRSLINVPDKDARIWYMNEASTEMWSSRTLDRNISSQYYYRLLQSPNKEPVEKEMKKLTQGLLSD